MEADQPEAGQPRITTSMFAAKFRSKYEVYQFLTIDVSAVLPPHDCVNIYFLKDLVMGRKKCKCHLHQLTAIIVIKEADAKQINVPYYEGLSIEKLLEASQQYPIITDYLPDKRDIARLPRQWIVNLIYTLVGDDFKRWVAEKIRSRNDRIASKYDLMLDLDPAIAKAFLASSMVSSKYYHNPIFYVVS